MALKAPEDLPILLGTQGWSYEEWKGPFYPPDLSPREYLSFYARVFSTVELDTTFYHIPRVSVVENWVRNTPPEFVFSAKLPQSITHEKRLVEAEEDLYAFLDVMSRLGDQLGPLLIQLPPSFEATERAALEPFLAHLPEGFRFACELRHRSWLTDETFDLLSTHRVAWVLVDSATMPLAARATTDFVYIRWLGSRRLTEMRQVVVDRAAELETWRERMGQATAQGHRIYGYFNNHYSGHSPATCRQMQALLGLEADRFERVRDQQPTLDLDLE